MAELGIDVGRDLGAPNSEIHALGVTWARTPITPRADIADTRARVADLRAKGVKVVMVIDGMAVDTMGFAEAADFYARAYGDLVAAFECGNEADAGWNFGAPDNSAAARRTLPNLEASWIMDPEVLTALLNAFRARLGSTFELWSGGLVCGQPEFLDVPGLNLSAATRVAIHPYNKDAAGARALLNHYARKLDSQPWGARFRGADSLVVTEFGFPSDANSEDSERDQAIMIEGVTNALITHPRLNTAILFCYDNGQDQGGFGLKAGGRQKPAFARFQSGALAIRPTAVGPI